MWRGAGTNSAQILSRSGRGGSGIRVGITAGPAHGDSVRNGRTAGTTQQISSFIFFGAVNVLTLGFQDACL